MMLMLKVLVLKMVKKYINTNWVFLAGMTQNKQKSLIPTNARVLSYTPFCTIKNFNNRPENLNFVKQFLNNLPGRTRDEN